MNLLNSLPDKNILETKLFMDSYFSGNQPKTNKEKLAAAKGRARDKAGYFESGTDTQAKTADKVLNLISKWLQASQDLTEFFAQESEETSILAALKSTVVPKMALELLKEVPYLEKCIGSSTLENIIERALEAMKKSYNEAPKGKRGSIKDLLLKTTAALVLGEESGKDMAPAAAVVAGPAVLGIGESPLVYTAAAAGAGSLDAATVVPTMQNVKVLLNDFLTKRRELYSTPAVASIESGLAIDEDCLKSFWKAEVNHWYTLHKAALEKFESVVVLADGDLESVQREATEQLPPMYVDTSTPAAWKKAMGMYVFMPDEFMLDYATIVDHMDDLGVWYSLASTARFGDAFAMHWIAGYLDQISYSRAFEYIIEPTSGITLQDIIVSLKANSEEGLKEGTGSRDTYKKAKSHLYLRNEAQAKRELETAIGGAAPANYNNLDPRILTFYEYLNFGERSDFKDLYETLEKDPAAKYSRYIKHLQDIEERKARKEETADLKWYHRPVGGYSKGLRENHIKPGNPPFDILERSKDSYVVTLTQNLLYLMGIVLGKVEVS